MANYATVQDLHDLWRHMSSEEESRAESLIPVVCASLREEAKKVGKNLDEMIDEDEDLAEVARSVVVDVVARTLMTSTDQEPMSQFSQSALGYTVSGTFLTPGGGMFIKKSELSRLGLKRQRVGTLEIYGGRLEGCGCGC